MMMKYRINNKKSIKIYFNKNNKYYLYFSKYIIYITIN